jgi:23S rRNA (adenine2503-C2)-methyltransferase
MLIGLDLAEMRALLGPGEPAFRARQVYAALYQQRVGSLDAITTLPAALRSDLGSRTAFGLPETERRFDSCDGTRRYLLRLADGKTVEAVFMPEDQRDTVCISTQIGCAVDCKFCLTALIGLERNLTAGEILGQVLVIARDNRLDPLSRRFNIVMMGQGEPLLNLDNVLKATRILADPGGFGLSEKRITLSTSGIIPKIAELGRAKPRPRLAVSLNASSEEQRRELIPITRKYHLADLLAACQRYPLRPWERLTFEYVLLKGLNDSDADARRVVRLLANLDCKVNLIAWNPGPEIPYESSDPERILAFQNILRRSFPTFIRKPRGLDIFAACGQLKRASDADLVALPGAST